MYLPSLSDLDEAAAIVYGAMQPTPQYSWPMLNQALGCEAWIKHENHTPTGAFKVRGGLVYLDRLVRRAPEVRGIITATRGNHGQSVAYAARRHGLTSTIVIPNGNSVEKTEVMRALGAEMIIHGSDYEESRRYAHMLAERDSLHYLGFHEDLLAGVASYWLELFRAQPDLDLVLVQIGTGTGICAAVAARQALGLKTRIIGVVSSAAPCYQLSFRAGHAVEAPATTQLADGLACRTPDPAALGTVLEFADDVLAVSDAEVANAMRLYYRSTHNLAEGAGAAGLAAALQVKDSALIKGRKIGIVMTGANVDAHLFNHILMESEPC